MNNNLKIENAPLGEIGFAMKVEAGRVEGDTMQISKELWLEMADRIMKDGVDTVPTINVTELFRKAEQENDGWIPISSGILPERLGRYKVTLADGKIKDALFDNVSRTWALYGKDVIAWMPHLKPYQPKEPQVIKE